MMPVLTPCSKSTHVWLQGEVYEEDDSCAGIDRTQAAMGGERTQDMHIAAIHEEADNDSGLAWQQAFDPTYGCFYYYRERTQVTLPKLL